MKKVMLCMLFACMSFAHCRAFYQTTYQNILDYWADTHNVENNNEKTILNAVLFNLGLYETEKNRRIVCVYMLTTCFNCAPETLEDADENVLQTLSDDILKDVASLSKKWWHKKKYVLVVGVAAAVVIAGITACIILYKKNRKLNERVCNVQEKLSDACDKNEKLFVLSVELAGEKSKLLETNKVLVNLHKKLHEDVVTFLEEKKLTEQIVIAKENLNGSIAVLKALISMFMSVIDDMSKG